MMNPLKFDPACLPVFHNDDTLLPTMMMMRRLLSLDAEI
jgi:hypothetical protein